MKEKIKFKIRKIKEKDREWIKKLIMKEWGSEKIISQGRAYYPHKLSGFAAVSNEKYLGMITYAPRKERCKLISLNALRKGKGIGTSLLEAVKKSVRKIGCKKIFLATTNDNLDALRFYQKRGFNIKAVYLESITCARKKLKPEIPLIGNHGIPIRDEIGLEIILK